MLNRDQIEAKLLEVATVVAARGPGYAQEAVVLRDVAKQLNATRLDDQQTILTVWHGLFLSGKLSWGYNVDNPGPPFFHLPAAELIESH